jgi:hypothetical protein
MALRLFVIWEANSQHVYFRDVLPVNRRVNYEAGDEEAIQPEIQGEQLLLNSRLRLGVHR